MKLFRRDTGLLMDCSNRELRETIGDLRIRNMDLERECSDLRVQLAVKDGMDESEALFAEMRRRMPA